jgi:hypothetical protein
MMFSLRVAASTKRVLLLNWHTNVSAANLTTFLVPATDINWTSLGTPLERFSATELNTNTTQTDVMYGQTIKQQIEIVGGMRSQKQVLVLQSNLRASTPCQHCPDGGDWSGLDYHHTCMFQFLFKPSELVRKTAKQHLAVMFPGQPPASLEYQAVHLRLGHQLGEETTVNRIGHGIRKLDKLLLAILCGLDMAQQSGINTSAIPLLLIADHRNVRRFSQLGMFKHVVTPNYKAVHTGRSNGFEGHLSAFVDLYLLARAKRLLLSHSGFSNAAWWLSGGRSCQQTLEQCHLACQQKPAPPYCLT